MDDPIVDPDRFQLAAALVDWDTLAQRDPAFQRAMRRFDKTPHRVVQLRWVMHSQYGYPTHPFEVFWRPAGNAQEVDLLTEEPSTFSTVFGWMAYLAPFPVNFVRAKIKVTSGSARVAAFAGAPMGSPLLGTELLPVGVSTVTFSGSQVGSLVIWGNGKLQTWSGVRSNFIDLREWTRIEIVGLPVDQERWSDVFALGETQGPVNAQMSPRDAAIDRFKRGAAPFGWASAFAAGRTAPDWQQANPDAFLEMMRKDVLCSLRDMIKKLPPNRHAEMRRQVTLAAQSGGDDGIADYSLLNSLLIAIMTDPVASLLAGFGTAIVENEVPRVRVADMAMSSNQVRSNFDFMVLATYDKGFDGHSNTAQLAALALAPKLAVAPPAPTNLAASIEGLRAPPHADQSWQPVIRLGWDRLPSFVPLRSAAYAHARIAGANTVAESLLASRKNDDAPQPIGIATNVENPASVLQVRGSDDSFAIPGTPATTTLLYGVAHEDIFGLWSAWQTTSVDVAEPPVQKVSIMSASLLPTAASSGLCPATLSIDFTWDWKSRSPKNISFAGRLYTQAKRGDLPTGGTAATGLQRAFGGPVNVPFRVLFDASGNVSVDAGGVLRHLSTDGTVFLGGPSGDDGVRRYRLDITGFNLDFATRKHIGMELTARGVEARAPNRAGAPSAPATIVSASDPRPPVILTEHEDVLLASAPDASGRSHALLQWPSSSAVGYFIYTAAESKLRGDWNMGETPSGATLSDRLNQLRDRFADHPAVPEGQMGDAARRYFNRLNDTAITATSYSAELPRGTRDIHLFMIVGVSAGGIESEWPSAADANRRKRPIAYAVPLRRVPEPPTLEVRRVVKPGAPGAFAAQVTLVTRPGVSVGRIDLYRVRNPEAALELDSMGMPFSVSLGQPGWTITGVPSANGAPAQQLGTAVGIDLPPGDWRPIYYRAAAWSAPDLTRGILAARSNSSAAREIIVPPAGPPPLSALVRAASGADQERVNISTVTTAPFDKTPLGDHRLKIEVHSETPGSPVKLCTWPPAGANGTVGDGRLAAIAMTPPTGDGLWRETNGTIRLRITRASTQTALRVRFQIDDPLGRFTERSLDVPADPLTPAITVGSVTTTGVPPFGYVVASTIGLPVTPAPGYRVRALLTTFSRPPVLIGFPSTRAGKPLLLFDLAYADIPVIGPGATGFPTAPPCRRRAIDARHTAIFVSVGRGGGGLQVTITAPDGSSTGFTQLVG